MFLNYDEKKLLTEKMVAAFLAAGNSSLGPINIKCADPVIHDFISTALKKEHFVIRTVNESFAANKTESPESTNENNRQNLLC